jgi:DNA primase
MNNKVDFETIKKDYPIFTFIRVDGKESAGTNGGEWHMPCPFCGGKDRFIVQPYFNGGRWSCRQCSPRWGDIVDFVAKQNNTNISEAIKIITVGNIPPAPDILLPINKPVKSSKKPDWQTDCLEVIIKCAYNLIAGRDWLRDNPQQLTQEMPANDMWQYLDNYWRSAPAASRAYHWLLQRGITDETINKFMIGYNEDWQKVSGDSNLCGGVVIPAFAGKSLDLWYVKVRANAKSKAKSKYISLKGSKLDTLFNANSLLKADYAIVVEGEFDCMLLSQYVPASVTVVTVGSAGTLPSIRWRSHFAALRGVYVVLDNDKAGDQGLSKWQELIPSAQKMPAFLRQGEDITDAWKRGADLSAWVEGVTA